MKDLTSITIILDRSGSMESVKGETITGFNSFLKSQKKESGEAQLSLIQFDHEYEAVYLNKPLSDASDLNVETYQPRGYTALLDAIGRTINEVGTRLANTSENERPNKVLFVIITDGEENSSREFNKPKINEMINHQKAQYNWDFLFIGANQDAIAEASQLGISADNSLDYAANSEGTQAVFASLSANIKAYRQGGSVQFSAIDREVQSKAGAKKR